MLRRVSPLLVVALENYLANVGSWVTVITGAVFVVCVLAFRRGIVGELGQHLGGAAEKLCLALARQA